MDVVEFFSTVGLGQDFSINAKETNDELMFPANQIGALLDLANIRDAMKDFDDDETNAADNQQNNPFITEHDLYRLLSASEKPIARPFQRWVGDVVEEICRTGRYEMRAKLTAEELEEKERAHALEAHKLATKKTKHDALMHANENTPLVYLAYIDTLPDGRILIKFGETDNAVAKAPYLQKEYGCAVYYVKLFVCQQPHQYEQWLRRQQLFAMHKYTEPINGNRHQEVLAVQPAEFKTIKRFMKKHVSMFDGWSVEQKLEKLRLQSLPSLVELEKHRAQSLPSLVELFKTWPVIVASISDPAAKLDAERSLASAMSSSLFLSPPISQKTTMGPSSTDDSSDEINSDDDDTAESSMATDFPCPCDVPPFLSGTGESHPSTSAPAPAPAPAPPPAPEHAHMFPPQPTKKLGRKAAVKVPPMIVTTEDEQLQRFLDECFDISDPDSMTHVAHVRAGHRLWCDTHVGREETNAMIEFFKQRFQVVQDNVSELGMKCSFYKGLTMKPWPWPVKVEKVPAVYEEDVASFVQEACEVHIMGRMGSIHVWDAFVEWKRKKQQQQQPQYDPTAKERNRFFSHMKAHHLYNTGVAIKNDGVGIPGFYGLYLVATATPECRAVGYCRSANTHTTLLKLDARGEVVDTIDSQDAFAHDVAKKSAQHVCKELTRCFADGMRPYCPGDGFAYMRSKDHAILLGTAPPNPPPEAVPRTPLFIASTAV